MGMIGVALCILAAKFLFHVPLRGSVGLLTAASMSLRIEASDSGSADCNDAVGVIGVPSAVSIRT